jgi:hypothetical protein
MEHYALPQDLPRMVALADQGSLGTTTPPGQSGKMVTSN